jgi:hypothetical protein
MLGFSLWPDTDQRDPAGITRILAGSLFLCRRPVCVGDRSLFLCRHPNLSSSLILCRCLVYETFRPYFFFERYQTILISFNIKKIINIKNNYIDINDISIKKINY